MQSGVVLAAEASSSSQPDNVETIKVYGSRLNKPLAELTGSSRLLTAEQLEQQVASQLADLFRHEAGVSITGYSGRPQNIMIRGITGNRVLILKDGITQADGFGAEDLNDSVGRFNFDLAEIKTIEVAKGPASSLFGSGALGGVVKITTKQAADYLHDKPYYLAGRVLYNGVNEETKASVTAAARVLGTPVMLGVSRWDGHEQQNYAGSRLPLAVEGDSVDFNIQLLDSKTFSLTYDADWLEQRTESIPRTTQLTQTDGLWQINSQFIAERQRNISQQLRMNWLSDQIWADEVSLQLFWRDTEHRNRQSYRLSRLFSGEQLRHRQLLNNDYFKHREWGLITDFTKTVTVAGQQHELLYGLQVGQNEFSRPRYQQTLENGQSQYREQAPFDKAEQQSFSFYLGDIIALSEQWQLISALRYDSHKLKPDAAALPDNSSSQWSASVKLNYQLNDIRLFWGYSQGYRAAPYDKVYGNIPHLFAFPPFEIVANTDLKAETSDSLETGVSWEHAKGYVAFSVFYNRYQDFIDWVNVRLRLTDGVLERQFVNTDEAYTYGAELNAGYTFNPQWSLSWQLGWLNGRNKTKDEYLRTLTPLESTLSLNYQLADLKLSLDAYGAAAMNRVPQCQEALLGINGDCTRSAGWFSLDLHGRYQVTPALTLDMAIRNLNDREYRRYQDIAGLSPEQISSVTQPERSVSVAIRYEF